MSTPANELDLKICKICLSAKFGQNILTRSRVIAPTEFFFRVNFYVDSEDSLRSSNYLKIIVFRLCMEKLTILQLKRSINIENCIFIRKSTFWPFKGQSAYFLKIVCYVTENSIRVVQNLILCKI